MVQKSTDTGPSYTKLRTEKQELGHNFDRREGHTRKKSGNSTKCSFQFAPYLAYHSICQFKDTQVCMRDKKKKNEVKEFTDTQKARS